MKTTETKTIKRQVIDLIRISDEEYTHHIWMNGLRYAEMHLNGDTYGVQVITRAKYYWAWWQNQWDQIEKVFLKNPVVPDDERWLEVSLYKGVVKTALVDYWIELHNPSSMIAYPGKIVWDEVHEICMKELIEESHKGFQVEIPDTTKGGRNVRA